MLASLGPGGPSRALRSEAGYSLLETIIALLVIAIGVFGILNVLVGTVGTNNLARQRSLAAHYAEKLIESQVRSQSWSSLSTTLDNALDDTDVQRELGPDATWDLEVSDISGTVKGITVTVKWKGLRKTEAPGWHEERVSIHTLAHSGGIGTIRGQYVNAE